jgi:hypothetical protein
MMQYDIFIFSYFHNNEGNLDNLRKIDVKKSREFFGRRFIVHNCSTGDVCALGATSFGR